MEDTKETRPEVDEQPIRKRILKMTDRSASQPARPTTKAPLSFGELLRYSLAESSMLERQVGFRASCQWCNRSHRGPCQDTNLAPRPKSLFVCSSAMSSPNDSEEWLTRATSRRASIDTSELGDSNYTNNIRDVALELAAAAAAEGKHEPLEIVVEPEVVRNKNVDGGYAWVILAVIFLINFSILGSHRAYGIIYKKLARDNGQTRADAAFPFSVMGCIEGMAGPLCGCLLTLTGSWRMTILIGTTLVTGGHLAAAFLANSQLGHVSSMGLITGFGLSFISISFFQINKAYFDVYRSIATGVGLSGAFFGTLLISRVCESLLDQDDGIYYCYLALGAFMAPNILLALLLKPLKSPELKIVCVSSSSPELAAAGPGEASSRSTSTSTLELCSNRSSSDSTSAPTPPVSEIDLKPPPPQQQVLDYCKVQIANVPEQVEKGIDPSSSSSLSSSSSTSAWSWIKPVVANPYFHLIWPTQLLFSWFNFTFGMIMIDFAKDRSMSDANLTHMVPAWACGQLFGRLVLSCLVDLKYISNKTFTIICFIAISAVTLMLNRTRTGDGIACPQFYRDIVLLALMFTMSMFIALLCILINNLVINYIEQAPLQPISLGLSSFSGSFFLLPRAHVIGHYRDTFGTYDALLDLLTYVALVAGLVWLLVPLAIEYLKVRFTQGARVRGVTWDLSEKNTDEIVIRRKPTNGTRIAV